MIRKEAIPKFIESWKKELVRLKKTGRKFESKFISDRIKELEYKIKTNEERLNDPLSR